MHRAQINSPPPAGGARAVSSFRREFFFAVIAAGDFEHLRICFMQLWREFGRLLLHAFLNERGGPQFCAGHSRVGHKRLGPKGSRLMNEREHQDEDAIKAISEDRGQSQKSGSLFHYTTASGLIGIISQRVLWATHANYLNDTAELKILSDLLTPQISQEFRQCIPKLIAANAFLPGLLNSYGESIYDSEARNACRAVMRAIEAVAPMYVTSFCMHAVGSEESRHGLLSQWRGYGRGGFAIEFDESELDRLTVLENTNRSIQMIATRKVEYTSHEKAANKDRFIGLGLAALSTAFREKTPNLEMHLRRCRIPHN